MSVPKQCTKTCYTVISNGNITIFCLFLEGKRHDAAMLTESRLLDLLEQHAFSPAGNPMCIYGDPAYPLRIYLQAPFRQVQLTPEMEEYNKSMSSVRVAVEWIFGDIVTYFKFVDFN